VALSLVGLIVHNKTELPEDIFDALRFDREFGKKVEALK